MVAQYEKTVIEVGKLMTAIKIGGIAIDREIKIKTCAIAIDQSRDQEVRDRSRDQDQERRSRSESNGHDPRKPDRGPRVMVAIRENPIAIGLS